MNDEVLEKIKQFAEKAHGDQKRKYTGEPYMGHPLRVMNTCREYTDDQNILAAALLHDVLEDTYVTKPQMKDFLLSVMNPESASKTMKLVVALTDVYTREKFPELNRTKRRAKESERLGMSNGDAQTVKYADIIDNSVDILNNDPEFARVYLKECNNILQKMTDGIPELRKRALQTVEDCIKRLK